MTKFRKSGKQDKPVCERGHLSSFHVVLSSRTEPTSRSVVLLMPARYLCVLRFMSSLIKSRIKRDEHSKTGVSPSAHPGEITKTA